MRLVEPYQEIKFPLAVENLRNNSAIHGCLDELIDRIRREPIPHQAITPQANLELWDLDLLLDHQVGHTGDVCNCCLHAFCGSPQDPEVIAVEFDAHLCFHP